MSDKKAKILIAEDEKPMAKALELKLSHAGYEIVIALNGQEALDQMAASKFDLVLLDLMMPMLDGFSVLNQLKEKGDTTPIVVLTNLNQQEDIQKAKDLGAIDFFIKSDTPLAEVIGHVENALKR